MDTTPIRSASASALMPFQGCFQSLAGSVMSKLFRSQVKEGQETKAEMPKPEVLGTAIKTDGIAKKIFDSLPTGPTPELAYVISDVSSIANSHVNLIATIQHQSASPGFKALGLFSGASILSGFVEMCRGYKEHAHASKIKDVWGQVFAKITLAKGGFETLGALFVLPSCILSLAAINASHKTAAVISAHFGKTGGVFCALTAFFISIPCSIRAGRLLNLRNKMDAKETSPIEVLAERLELSRKEKRKLAYTIVADPATRSEFKEFDPDEKALLTDTDKNYINDYVDAFVNKGHFDDVTGDKVKSHLMLAFSHARQEKIADLERLIGSENVEMLQAYKNGKKPLDTGAFIEKLRKEMTFHIRFNAFAAAVTFVAGAALIAGIVASGGSLGLALAIIGVITSLGALGADGYCLYETYKKGQLKSADKVIFGMMVALMVTSIVAATLFSGGIAPLVATSVIGLVWMGLSIYSHRRYSSNAKEHEEALRQMQKLAAEEAEKLAS